MKYTVYSRTNLLNGMKYIGQTQNFERRERDWKELSTKYANKYLLKDRESGLDNWTTEILAECDTREESWELEKHYIEEFNTIYPFGYNLSKGGASSNGVVRSDETKKKISDTLQGRVNTPKSIPVYQYTLDGKLVKIWPSIRECGRNGFDESSISKCCNGIRKKHKGYKWSFEPL